MDTNDKSAAELLNKRAKKRKKRDRFLRTRMWFSTFISFIFNDRGTIPANIGNNLMVLNNMYITKNSLSTEYLVWEYSDITPVGFTDDLVSTVKESVPDVLIDCTFKNQYYKVDLKDKGLESRIETWKNTLKNPFASENNARRAARLLFSVDELKAKPSSYKTRTYVTVRAKDGITLSRAMEATEAYLESIEAVYKPLKSDLENHLKYRLLMSDTKPRHMKDIPYSIQTMETLSQSLPSEQGINDVGGTLMGIIQENNNPYNINFRVSSNAKNIGVFGSSGFGKTFLVIGWVIDALCDGYCAIIKDIKGTEFTPLTKAFNGTIISLRSDSTEYVDTFRWRYTANIENTFAHADYMFRLSKLQLQTIVNANELVATRVDSMLEEYLTSFYISIGASKENPNTWKRTEVASPQYLFDFFESWLSTEVIRKYSDVYTLVHNRLKLFLSRSGSESRMFTTPLDYDKVIDDKIVTFDFGLNSSTVNIDNSALRLKHLYSEIIRKAFIAKKKSQGLWTFVVLEESQIVGDDILKSYAEEITLGRARNQVTVLLGNSIKSLINNKASAPIIDNLNILVFGVLTDSTREAVIKEFDLDEKDASDIDNIARNPDYEYTFKIINKMSKNATKALIKSYVPERVRNGKLYKVVDTHEET